MSTNRKECVATKAKALCVKTKANQIRKSTVKNFITIRIISHILLTPLSRTKMDYKSIKGVEFFFFYFFK